MIRVKRPRMLGAGFAETARLEPEALGMDLPLRDVATATMTLPDGGPEVGMHAWVELFTAKGSAGIFRVTDMTHDTDRRTDYTLRHAIDTLADDVWAAQTDYDGTVSAYLTALLAQQTTARWQMGTCDDTASWKRSGINYTKLSDLLAEVVTARENYYLTYDFSTTPWTLNFLALPQTVSSEFRLARNATHATINRNDGDMCNRLYLSVNTTAATGHTTVNTVDLKTYNNTTSQAAYGVIVKTADIDTADVVDADAWAADFMSRRAEPAVQITIDGLELKALTGETWDEYDRGRLARVAFGELGETATERVENVNYPDVLGAPETVTVELANRLDAFTETIARLQTDTKNAGGAARAAGRGAASKGDLNYWAMVVKMTDLENLYITGIELDAQSGATIYNLAQGFVSQYGAIKVNREKISLVVEESSGGNVIKAASIVAAINDSASSVVITADHIYLNGSTKATDIFSTESGAIKLTATHIYNSFFHGEKLELTGQDPDFRLAGHRVGWLSKSVVTGISQNANMEVTPTTETIYYLGRTTA